MARLRDDPGGFSPQRYEQLVAAYTRDGRDADARRVAIARHRARRRALGRLNKVWGWFLDVTVAYAHRPWQAGLWLVGLVAISSLIFGKLFEAGGNGPDLTPARQLEQCRSFSR